MPQAMQDNLDFPVKNMRTRRDNDRFIDLIATVCFIRQYQKEVNTFSDGAEYVYCDIEDYSISYEIIKNILPATLFELPPATIDLYDEIRAYVKHRADEERLSPVEVNFTQRDVREHSEFGGEFIKKHLRLLVDYEYITYSGNKTRGARRNYRLIADEAIENIDISAIPIPEEMSKKL
jgi:hypothetical protein